MSPLNPAELPIVPHSGLPGADPECCGCLIVKELENGMANLVCNECGALIRTVPTDEAPQILLRMAMDEGICNATCRHCGAFNVILGFSSVSAFTCRECGEGVSVNGTVQ